MIRTIPSLHRLVGHSLRQYRVNAGWTEKDAAAVLECHVSKISRIETGERGIRPRELRELLAEYGVGREVREDLAELARQHRRSGWWTEYSGALSGTDLDFFATESMASGFVSYAPVLVPELLQTADYAEAVVAADVTLPGDIEAGVVAATLERQRAALREGGPAVAVVIGEAALRQQTGGPTVMRRQLGHLAELARESSQIVIRVLLLSAGPPAVGAIGGFSVLQFGGLPELGLVRLAGLSGGICLGDPSLAAGYQRAFTGLQQHALEPASSARKLAELARAR